MAGVVMTVRLDPDAVRTVQKVATAWLPKVAIQVTNEAKRLCPVDTGYLRSSIEWHIEGDAALIGSTVVYAAAIEFGHSKKAPQGYLRPALDKVAGMLRSA